VLEANGGYLAKVSVKNFNDGTMHTIITSRALFDETKEKAGKPDCTYEQYFQVGP
jgi:hypothetical protein